MVKEACLDSADDESFRDRLNYFLDHWNGAEAFQVAVVIVIGLICGLASVLLYYGVSWVHGLFFQTAPASLGTLGKYFIFLAPAIGGLLSALITSLSKEAKGHGVPGVMEAVAMRGGNIPGVVAPITMLASAFTIGSGGSAGREGPIIQIGSSIGSFVGRYLHMSDIRVRNMVATGAAAGLAATFNAPLAGVIFSLEVILGEFSVYAFSHIVIAAVVAASVAHSFLGNAPAFSVTGYQLVSYHEYILYAALGVVAALGSRLFTRVLYGVEDYFDQRVNVPEFLKPALGGLLVGLIGLFTPQVFGAGDLTVEETILGELPFLLMFALIFTKPLATAFTLGSGGTGGVFSPSLFIGAVLGGTFGVLANLLFPEITAPAGAYAIVGMGAVLAGSMQAPLTAIIMLFELTRNYQIILPLMIACVISYIIANFLGEDTIYTYKLLRRGIQLRAGKDLNILRSIKVSQVMHRRVDTVSSDMTIGDVVKLMQSSRHTGYPVLDPDGKLVGIITLQDIRDIPDPGRRLEVPVRAAMTSNLVVAYPDENLAEVGRKMLNRGIGRIPVVDREDNSKLVGLITRSTLLDSYNKAVVICQRPELKQEITAESPNLCS
ncbi:MAG: chloride channel protein [Firmicutes bacterium]|nr:chloride channel protein [Bacillota bacterium]